MLLLVLPITAFAYAQEEPVTPVSETQSALVSCTDTKIGQQIRINCVAAGVLVLSTTIPLPTIQLPGATITLPNQTETVTVRPEPITVPGPTTTVTKTTQPNVEPRIIQGPTRTVTASQTVTGPTATSTATVTATPTPSRQPVSDGDTMESPDEEDSVVVIPELDLSFPEAVGLGLLSVLAIALLILLGMYSGYYIGYKDSEKQEAKFLRSLLRR